MGFLKKNPCLDVEPYPYFICKVCSAVVRCDTMKNTLRLKQRICYTCSDIDDLFTLAHLKERSTK